MSQQINLYQAEFRLQRAHFPASGILRAILLWLIGLAAIYGHGAWQLRTTRGDMTQLEHRVQLIERWASAQRPQRDGSKAAEELARQAEAAEAQLRVLNEAIVAVESGAIGSEKGYSGFFHAFSQARVAEVWLTGFQFDPRGELVKLSGRALDSEGPARLVQGLREQDLLRGLQWSSVQIARGDKGRYLDFSLQAQAVAAGATLPTALVPPPPGARP